LKHNSFLLKVILGIVLGVFIVNVTTSNAFDSFYKTRVCFKQQPDQNSGHKMSWHTIIKLLVSEGKS